MVICVLCDKSVNGGLNFHLFTTHSMSPTQYEKLSYAKKERLAKQAADDGISRL